MSRIDRRFGELIVDHWADGADQDAAGAQTDDRPAGFPHLLDRVRLKLDDVAAALVHQRRAAVGKDVSHRAGPVHPRP